ncbi:MAG TPA: hypothetical protein VFP27_17855, partial [Mycobacterium sp.]|nr:hypothetical protein [Mycobacterium sp.]
PAPQPVAPAPQPVAPAPQPVAPAPQIQAPPQPKKKQPRVIEAPKVDAPKTDAPKVDARQVDAPKVDASRVDAPKVDTPAPPAAVDQPAKLADPKLDAEVPKNLTPGQLPEAGINAPDKKQPSAADEAKPGTDGSRGAEGVDLSDPSTVSKAAQQIPTAQPETLQAPEQDIQLAKQSKPIEVKPEPATKQDVDALSSAINLSSATKLGPFESEFDAGSELSVGADRIWDSRVRQWDQDWIEYDEFYRPIIFNPFRAPVRIVYALANATRMLVIQPLTRVIVDVAELAAYSFTAVVLGAANVVSDVANVAADVVNVAVGTIFGGGYLPSVGLPFVSPPPLLSYDNVPVQVRYSDATYEPFLVRQIVDIGDDVQYGGRKVLLDGATPAWGQWVTSPTGERQFEVHRTQQYPGLGDPQEAPLAGDYQMRLASDESANVDRTQMYLMAAAGVIAGLGFGALGLVFYLGRRRPQL